MTQITTANACAQSTAAPMGAAAITILRRLYGFPDSMTDDEVRRAVKARIDAYEEGEIDQQPAASAETIQDLLRQIRDELRWQGDFMRASAGLPPVCGCEPAKGVFSVKVDDAHLLETARVSAVAGVRR